MAPQALSNVSLIINNDVVPYAPNTLVYDPGNPERTVSPQVIGGSSVENVVTENFETAKGKVTFELKTTSENEQRVLDYIENFASNVIRIVSQDNVARVFEEAVVINKPEFNTGADGTISIEFESKAAVIA